MQPVEAMHVYVVGKPVTMTQRRQYDNVLGDYLSDKGPVTSCQAMTPSQRNTFLQFKKLRVESVFRDLTSAQEHRTELDAEYKRKHGGSLYSEWRRGPTSRSSSVEQQTRGVHVTPVYKVTCLQGSVGCMRKLDKLLLQRIEEVWINELSGSLVVNVSDHPGLNNQAVFVDAGFMDS